MLNCTHILEFVQSPPPPLRTQEQQSYSITPPTVWHKNQDKIKNVELYIHFRNCALPSQGPTWPKDNNPT